MLHDCLIMLVLDFLSSFRVISKFLDCRYQRNCIINIIDKYYKKESILPCGTPDNTGAHEECLPFFVVYLLATVLSTAICFHRCHGPLVWAKVSLLVLYKAFVKSKYKMSKLAPSVKISRNSSRLVEHDLCDINPCWEGLISRLVSKCSVISSLIIDSMTRHGIGVRDTGRWFSGLLLEPFFF